MHLQKDAAEEVALGLKATSFLYIPICMHMYASTFQILVIFGSLLPINEPQAKLPVEEGVLVYMMFFIGTGLAWGQYQSIFAFGQFERLDVD